MKRIIVCFFIVSFISLFSFQSFSQEVNIFSEGKPIDISFIECSHPSSIHSVKVDREKWKIYWKWDNKKLSWCRWRTKITPEINLSEYFENGYFIVNFIGAYQGGPPQVVLIYSGEKHTNPINLSRHFIEGSPELGVTVKIPLKAFKWKPDPSKNSIKLRAIQFGAGYNSFFGKITITRIGFSRD